MQKLCYAATVIYLFLLSTFFCKKKSYNFLQHFCISLKNCVNLKEREKWYSFYSIYVETLHTFVSEMAERHDAKAILRTARNLVTQLQILIENK